MITAFCLALAIHFEARGESLEGQLMVARTVANRAAHPQFPDDECSVIYQRGQFPWARDEIALQEGVDLIEGEAVGTEWKRGCRVFIGHARAALKGADT